MAITPEDNLRMVADANRWQELLERLVELRQETCSSDSEGVPAVTKQDWRKRAESVRRQAEHTDPGTRQALLELAESYDKLAERDADNPAT